MNGSEDDVVIQDDTINDILEDLQSNTNSENQLLSTIAIVLSSVIPIAYVAYKSMKKLKVSSKCCGSEVDIQVGTPPSTEKPKIQAPAQPPYPVYPNTPMSFTNLYAQPPYIPRSHTLTEVEDEIIKNSRSSGVKKTPKVITGDSVKGSTGSTPKGDIENQVVN
jgi:hypothetical protein